MLHLFIDTLFLSLHHFILLYKRLFVLGLVMWHHIMKKERESCRVSDISLGFYLQYIHLSSWLNSSTVMFRSLVLKGNDEGHLLFQKRGITEDCKFTWTNNSSSESITESDNIMRERSSDSDEHKGGTM